MTGQRDPHLARYAGNLANALRQQHELTHREADLREAVGLYRQACAQGLDTATAVAFYAAREWAAWADSRQAWPEAAEAYRAGTAAMWRLLEVQAARPDQETWLRVTQTMPAGPATHTRGPATRARRSPRWRSPGQSCGPCRSRTLSG